MAIRTDAFRTCKFRAQATRVRTIRAQAIRNVGNMGTNNRSSIILARDRHHGTSNQMQTITSQTVRIMRQTEACNNQKYTQLAVESHLRKVPAVHRHPLSVSKSSVTIRVWYISPRYTNPKVH